MFASTLFLIHALLYPPDGRIAHRSPRYFFVFCLFEHEDSQMKDRYPWHLACCCFANNKSDGNRGGACC